MIFALRLIQLAQAAGFTLAETKSLLESSARNSRPASVWKPFARAKRAEIQKQIALLQRRKTPGMSVTNQEWKLNYYQTGHITVFPARLAVT
jgi:DNA-binding transcriptional MerR regulator